MNHWCVTAPYVRRVEIMREDREIALLARLDAANADAEAARACALHAGSAAGSARHQAAALAEIAARAARAAAYARDERTRLILGDIALRAREAAAA
jgi:hypothetical protein